MQSLTIRAAKTSDIPLVRELILALAEYEKLAHVFELTETQLREALFGERPSAECLIALVENEPAGFALFFTNFSTFLGRPGLYLEDLFVKPHLRGKGIGKALLRSLAGIAVSRNYGRMEWAVLDWNTPSIEFYKSLGACALQEWTVFRMDEDAIQEMAA